MSKVFVNGPGDQGSIRDQVMPKTQKMVLVTALLNTQYYKVHTDQESSEAIQGKEQCLSPHLGVQAIEKGAFRLPSTVVQLTAK